MQNLEDQIHAAWKRVQSRLEDEPALLAARLGRRRKPTLTRPPRAWCLTIRASDHRIPSPSSVHHSSFSIHHSLPSPSPSSTHHSSISAHHSTSPEPIEHQITVTAPQIKKLCQPVRLSTPGETLEDVAKYLGTTPMGLRNARLNKVFRCFHIPPTGGRGRPSPLLYTEMPLDPNTANFAMPDPVWLWTANYIASRLPDDFQQTLSREPFFRTHVPRHFYDEYAHPELEESEPKRRSLKLPDPEPDNAWYKWSRSGHFLGTDPTNWRKSPQDLGERPPRNKPTPWRKENRGTDIPARRPQTPAGSLLFNGFQWRCPNCQKTCRTLYYPVAPINLLAHTQPKIAQMIEVPRKLKGFACAKCHSVKFNSTISKDYWNEVITYLTAGLLYGHEVPRPTDQFPKTRKNKYAPRPNAKPSKRRPQVIEQLLEGLSYYEIGQRLGLSERTINDYAGKIYKQNNIGGRNARADLAKKLNKPAPAAWTTKKEQVRQHLKAGLTVHEIAARMGITKHAVEHHVGFIRSERNARGPQTAQA